MLPAKYRKNPLTKFLGDDFFNFNTDLFGTDTQYLTNEEGQTIIQIDVPGFNKDNLKVEISEGVLMIQGKTDTRQIFKQYTIGQVQNVNAKIKDGILTLTLVEPEKETMNIDITS